MEEMQKQENQPQTEPGGELRSIRDRSDKDELTAGFRSTLLGGINRSDVLAYVDRLKAQWLSAEQTYKGYIADLSREKEALRRERDALENRVTEHLAELSLSRETSDPLNHPQVLELYEQARSAQEALGAAQSRADEAQRRSTELEEQLERLVADSSAQEARLRAMCDERHSDSQASERYDQRCSQYETTIAELNARLSDQLYELSDATARFEDLSREAEQREGALRAQVQQLSQEAEQREGALRAQAQEAREAERREEALRAQVQEQVLKLQEVQQAVLTQKNSHGDVAALEHQAHEAVLAAERAEIRLTEARSEVETTRTQLREQMAANYALREQVRTEARERVREEERARKLENENRALSIELEDVGGAIRVHMQQIDDARAMNVRLKESLNSLLVKAEALIRENEMLSSQVRTERDRAAQYQAVHERLVDILSRVRMANQLLSERMSEVDRALSGSTSRGLPPTAGGRRMSLDTLNLDGGGSSALYDMIQELNTIQSTLTQLQTTPMAEEDKMSSIRYRMEKLEVACPPKKDGESADFRLTGIPDPSAKTW